jgi:plasmid stability protein
MATLTVRKLADATYESLGRRAKTNNRSLEAEVREILDREAKAFDIKAWMDEVREIRKRSKPLPNGMTSLDLLREDRDSW